MTKTNETWTRKHELALVYVALAYGTDNTLNDDELQTLIATLKGWDAALSTEAAQEIVLEAMAIYLQDNGNVEVTRTIHALKQHLSAEERKHALQDVVRIAEADGVLLSSESSLISTLADLWDLRATARALLAQTTATVADEPDWSLLHDMALVCVVLAHSTDNDLSTPEIEAILNRLRDWQPDLEDGALRAVVRDAIRLYGAGPDKEMLGASVGAIRKALPPIQRIAFLDDLMHVAQSDGVVNDNERAMLLSLSEAWGVDVRLDTSADTSAPAR